MKLKSLVAAVAMLVGSSLASAATIDLGSSVLTYDETTVLGSAIVNTSGTGLVSFGWKLNTQLGVAVFGTSPSSAFNDIAFPSFTITSKSGFALNGPVTAFLGDLRYQEDAASLTTAAVSFKVSSDAFGPVTQSFSLNKTPDFSIGGVTYGSYSGTDASPALPFSFYKAEDVFLKLTASGTNAVVNSNNLNRLNITFNAAVTPVPEPETYAMLLAGLGVVGFLARRRRQS